ncbi:MAG TPA: hypothetical protein VF755_01225 [Catenuloplanes sp.]|jgi:hypothetical protein
MRVLKPSAGPRAIRQQVPDRTAGDPPADGPPADGSPADGPPADGSPGGQRAGEADDRPDAPAGPPSPRRGSPALLVGALSGVVAAALTGYLVATVLQRKFSGDFPSHLKFTVAGIDTLRYPGNALFYLLNALFAGFSTDRGRLVQSLLAVLMIAAAAKVWISVAWVAAEHRRSVPADRSVPAGRGMAAGRLPFWAAGAAGLCAFTFSLPAAYPYLGQLPPNVWHNSTTMLLMPFAIGLFWASLAYLRTGGRRLLWIMLLLAALNVAAKPSFVFCFLVVFPLAALLTRRNRGEVLRAWLVTAATAVFVAAQYVYIYGTRPGGPNPTNASGVALDPLRVWSVYSDNIPVSLLCSYFFPLVALLAGGAAIRRHPAVRYAVALAGVGLLFFVLFKESGYRELHGNFIWQAVVTNYLLFLALVGAAVPWLRRSRFRWRQAAVVLAFALHVAAGVHYLHHYLTAGTFA